MTIFTIETTIAAAIARSQSHKEVVKVSVSGYDAADVYALVSDRDGNYSDENDGSIDCYGADWRINVTIETTRDEIQAALEAADLCSPEQVGDALLAVANAGGDWRAELAKAIANDSVEAE
jgi:hypothetical protein